MPSDRTKELPKKVMGEVGRSPLNREVKENVGMVLYNSVYGDAVRGILSVKGIDEVAMFGGMAAMAGREQSQLWKYTYNSMEMNPDISGDMDLMIKDIHSHEQDIVKALAGVGEVKVVRAGSYMRIDVWRNGREVVSVGGVEAIVEQARQVREVLGMENEDAGDIWEEHLRGGIMENSKIILLKKPERGDSQNLEIEEICERAELLEIKGGEAAEVRRNPTSLVSRESYEELIRQGRPDLAAAVLRALGGRVGIMLQLEADTRDFMVDEKGQAEVQEDIKFIESLGDKGGEAKRMMARRMFSALCGNWLGVRKALLKVEGMEVFSPHFNELLQKNWEDDTRARKLTAFLQYCGEPIRKSEAGDINGWLVCMALGMGWSREGTVKVLGELKKEKVFGGMRGESSWGEKRSIETAINSELVLGAVEELGVEAACLGPGDPLKLMEFTGKIKSALCQKQENG